jgi:class 3 adenylate cyclase/tetratricopeptide (TPR) repeat protein
VAACPSCGRENAEDARYCSACGGALVAKEAAREQRKVVTVLFCDVVGSTALGESTDPEALRARMRSYFDDLRRIVERHGGTVEKFVGDAVLAVFGIPVAHEDDALRAVRAAWEMREGVARHGLEARIGVDTGEVVVGGEAETLVTGDAVNVAARLEQAAQPGDVLIGSATRDLVRDAVRLEAVEPFALKGKSRPVEAARLLDVMEGALAPVRRPESPLVGRERERQRLWRDYEDAAADRRCRLFTLLGPAGIGKSRLVADFLEHVGDEADVLRGRCLSYGEGITYWPLVEILTDAGVDPGSVVASTPEETRVAFRRLLEARAAGRPQVVVVDDLHWAEPVFVDLVEHVADLSRDAPILLLCIARTELLDARPDWGGGKLNATSLLLEPLQADACDELIENLLAGTELDARARERIAAASEGNALFVEEMVAMVRERADGGELVVPPTIQALLQARLDLLDDEDRLVLGRAAIEGQVFHRAAVDELARDELRSDLDERLANLVRKELVRPDVSRTGGDDAFRFRHILIRDAAYAALPKELRARLHERFADWLERTDTDTALELDEIVGYHLEQAYGLLDELGLAGPAEQELARRAAAKLLAGGLSAHDRGDETAAVGLLRHGVELLPTGDPDRLEALPELALALSRIGNLDQAVALLDSMIDEAHDAGAERTESRARLHRGALVVRMNPEANVEDTLEQALEVAASLERLDDVPGLARAHAEIGMARFMLGRAAEGEADLRTAADLARRAGDRPLELRTLSMRFRPVLYGPAAAPAGLAYSDEVLAEVGGSGPLAAHALQARAMLASMQGELSVFREAAARAWLLIDEFGLTLSKGQFGGDIGYAWSIAGDLDEAEAHLRAGAEVFAGIGETGNRATVTAQLADVLARQGRLDEAARVAEDSKAISAADDLDAQPRWRAALARVLASQGESGEAERLAREALDLLEPTDFIVLQAEVFDLVAELFAAAGRVDEAKSALERALALHERKANVVSAERSRAALSELRAATP